MGRLNRLTLGYITELDVDLKNLEYLGEWNIFPSKKPELRILKNRNDLSGESYKLQATLKFAPRQKFLEAVNDYLAFRDSYIVETKVNEERTFLLAHQHFLVFGYV